MTVGESWLVDTRSVSVMLLRFHDRMKILKANRCVDCTLELTGAAIAHDNDLQVSSFDFLYSSHLIHLHGQW